MNRDTVVKNPWIPNTVKPKYNSDPKKMVWWPLYTGWPLSIAELCEKYKATKNFRRFSGNHNIQADCLYKGLSYTGLNVSTSQSYSLLCKHFPKVLVEKIWQKVKTYSVRWLFY